MIIHHIHHCHPKRLQRKRLLTHEVVRGTVSPEFVVMEISHSFTIIINLSRCLGTLVVSLWELLFITGIVEVRRDEKVSLALVLFGCVEQFYLK